jgi:hypothetical protein
MRLFLEKLQCNKKYEAFLRKRWLNRHFASAILFGLMLLLGNSCIEGGGSSSSGSCPKPTGTTGTITIIIPKIPASSLPCGYNPSLLRGQSDLARDFTNYGWVTEIAIGGKCSGEGVWEEKYTKDDFNFSKNFDGSMEFVLSNVPYNEALSLKLDLFSNCNDNTSGQCFQAGNREYRAKLIGTIRSFRPTGNAHTFQMVALSEDGVKWGADSGCQ